MRISFIGSGKVATHLASACASQHQIVQIMSRNVEHAKTLACRVDAEPIQQFEQLDASIDLLIISVSDHAISSVIQAVHPYLPNTFIVHTSGSTSIQQLTQHHANAGVFYPLQTFSFEREVDWSETPLFIEASTDEGLKHLEVIANSLSNKVYHYNSEQRLSLHLAAVFACNFTNYFYDAAKQIVDQQQVDFSLLYPLILETARKATLHDPVLVQTGPAVRNDQNILNMHQDLLSQAKRPDLAEIYQLLSQAIINRRIDMI